MSISTIGSSSYNTAGNTKVAQTKTQSVDNAKSVNQPENKDVADAKPQPETKAEAVEQFSSQNQPKPPARDPVSSKSFVGIQSKAAKQLTGGPANAGGAAKKEKEAEDASFDGHYSDDPYLDHKTQTCNPEISQTPLFENGKWDGPAALNALHQVDDNPDTKSDEHRCGPSTLLAGAVMKGPESVAKICDNLYANGKNLTKEDQAKLEEINHKMLGGEGTVEDLHLLQDMMYRSAGGNGGDLKNEQLLELQKQTGLVDKDQADKDYKSGEKNTNSDGTVVKEPNDSRTFTDPERGQKMISNLKPGESRVMNIDPNGNGAPHHYVTVGKDKDGREYIYDPYPKENEPNVVYKDQRPDAFDRYTYGATGCELTEAQQKNNGFKNQSVDIFVGGVMNQ